VVLPQGSLSFCSVVMGKHLIPVHVANLTIRPAGVLAQGWNICATGQRKEVCDHSTKERKEKNETRREQVDREAGASRAFLLASQASLLDAARAPHMHAGHVAKCSELHATRLLSWDCTT
jgi:hypothetical protein